MEKATSSFRFPPKQLSKTCLQDVFKSGRVCRIRVVTGYLDSRWVEEKDVSNTCFNSIAFLVSRTGNYIRYFTGDDEPNLIEAKDCHVRIMDSTNELCKYRVFSRDEDKKATVAEKIDVVFEVDSVYCSEKDICHAVIWITENWYDRGTPLFVSRN